MEQPEAFVVIGKLDSDIAVADELGIDENTEDGNEFDTGEEFSLDMEGTKDEEGNNEEEPIPETTEEPNENIERSGGRRASNLNREVASKEMPSGNILTEARYTVYDYAESDTYQDEEEKGNEPSQYTIYDNEKNDFYYDEAGNNPVFDNEDDVKEYIKTHHLNENKEALNENKITIENYGEIYTIDPEAKTYTIKTAKGEKTFTFDEMNEFVKAYRGVNRIHKPMSLLAYTDYKYGALNKWNVKTEAIIEEKVDNSTHAGITIKYGKGDEDLIDLDIAGVSEITPQIKKALQDGFAGVFKSDYTGDLYTQDIKVTDDVWMEYIGYDKDANVLKFVIDGKLVEENKIKKNCQ